VEGHDKIVELCLRRGRPSTRMMAVRNGLPGGRVAATHKIVELLLSKAPTGNEGKVEKSRVGKWAPAFQGAF